MELVKLGKAEPQSGRAPLRAHRARLRGPRRSVRVRPRGSGSLLARDGGLTHLETRARQNRRAPGALVRCPRPLGVE